MMKISDIFFVSKIFVDLIVGLAMGRGDPPHYPLIPEIGEPATSLGLYWAKKVNPKV